ncbi:hypothetical protein [Halorubrum yunnanense]|uniref:N-acetyltransferase domain-containing protein n=1 Tax=Halorubrum yunnanense TaxID=1526162 RepID=A0ABD5YKE1_9EURY|nr:hypothetical protein [Halorubrum yunnanense]
MRIRDALESDAEALAAVIGRPEDVVRNMIHDRSVRVAVGGGSDGDGDDGDSDGDDGDSDGDDGDSDGEDRYGNERGSDDEGDNDDEADEREDEVLGFVSFDVRGGTVHVTDFDGSGSTIERLFEEPRRFARREEMGVEVVVPNDEASSEVIEASGFAATGRGPRFEGRRTTRYRIDFEELDERNGR